MQSNQRRINSGSYSQNTQPQPSVLRVVNILLRERRTVMRVLLLTMIVGAIVTLSSRRSYTAASSFTPVGMRTTGSMSGLAAQLGLTIPGGQADQNPSFYADLVKSRQILGGIADIPFPTGPDSSATQTLAQVYDIRGQTLAITRDRTRRELLKHVAASVDPRTGIVRLETDAPTALLAQRINQKLLDLLNDFNLRHRQSQARSEREFIERRLDQVRADLRSSENQLAEFMRRNRDFRNSPELSFQYERLNRGVGDQQNVYTMLIQSYEQSKIEEIRNTPVITVVEQPEIPVLPDSRGWIRKLSFAFVIGLMSGVFLALARATIQDFHGESVPETEELGRLVAEVRQEWRHPLRSARRLLAP
jgi:uncharacterized protein involved in exopolysaccharide biosynthesis